VVVEEEKCDRCHGDLRFHGDLRTEVRYCVVCHDPWATDEARRPDVDPASNPPQTIDMKVMVHRIHTGEELQNDYTVYGFGAPPTGLPGAPVNFNEVLYPGDRRDCEACHAEETYVLPPPDGAIATVIRAEGTVVPQPDAVRPPSTAACTGCHDGDDTLTHAMLNSIVTSPTEWRDSCSVCHGEGKEFATTEVHSR
jgi:OmcA/MtrC family decaheme c-type cytochrome